MKPIVIGLVLSLIYLNFAQARNDAPDIELVNSEDQRWRFRQITVTHASTGLTISGRMNANARHGLSRGHVDIAAWSADNTNLIAETTTDYSPRRLTRRASRKGGVQFSAKLPLLPPDARIKIAFHRDELQAPQNPSHKQTVAR